MNECINKKKVQWDVIISIYIYRVLLDWCYFSLIVPNYGYYGFEDNRSIITYIISWIVLIFFSFLMERIISDEKPMFSNITIFVLTLISVVPFSTLICSGILSDKFIVMNAIYWLAVITLCLFIRKIKIKPKVITIGTKIIDAKIAMIFGIFSVAFVIFLSYKYTHFRLNFNLFNVYELRAEAKNYNFPRIFQYLFPWTRVLNIIFLAYACKNNKKILAIIFFLAQMLSFGIDGLKSTFFMPFLVIFICAFYKNGNFKYYKKMAVWGINGLLLFGIMEYIIFGTYNIVNIIIRRVLIIPAYLNYCYVDFFSSHDAAIFGFKTQYDKLGNIIGELYFNRPDMNCNNGLISDAVANLGTVGIVLMPILLIIVLRILDNCTVDLDEKIFFTVAIYFAVILSNSFLTTSLITHGLAIAGIVLLMLRSKRRKENYEKIE